MDIGRFQCGIAAVIYHPPTRTYLLLQRSRQKDFGGAEWECVTGRVNQSESFEAAVHREVQEELNVAVQLDFIIGTTHFYRGAAVPENELLGVKYACTLIERESLKISEEHTEYRWLSAQEIYSLLSTDHWLSQTIQRAELMRQALPQTLLQVFHAQGFETT